MGRLNVKPKKRENKMKKSSIIFGLALAMLAGGCAKDATEDVAVKGNKVIIGVEADATRTSLGAKDGETYPVLWSKEDVISVNGVVSKKIAEQFVGTSSAQFEVEGVAAPYKVVYPADAASDNSHVIVASLAQDYVAGSFDGYFAGAAMVGYSETEQVVMKNVCGFIKLPIKKGDEKNIAKVVIRANNLESLAGVFEVNYETGEIIRPYAGTDFVEVTSETGIPYVEDMAVVVAAVAPGTYAKGFTVEVIATDGAYMTKTAYANTGCTVAAGKVLVMPEIEFFPNKQKTEITNATQLQAFLDAASAGDYSAWKNSDGVVELGADIDMTGVTITPATKFDGVFDGRGYLLVNWTTSNGLFKENSGTIKNILIGETCKFNLPHITEDSVFGMIVDSNTGIVSGCQNYADMTLVVTEDLGVQYKAAPLVGYSSGETALVTNCYNSGNVSITFGNLTASSHYIGGIVGNTSGVDGVVCLSNCINVGNVAIKVSGDTGKNIYLGGLAGACNTKGTVNNCINRGAVRYDFPTGSSGAYPNVGGIVGYSAASISNSTNYGDVTFTTNGNVTRPAVAGIAGYMNGEGNNLVNYGNILASGDKFAKAAKATSGGVGGAQWPIVAGVVGCTGTVASGAKRNISNSYNYGNVTMVNPNGSCVCGCAGVVAYASGNVINCHNEGNITASAGTQIYIAGVEGLQYIGGDKLENCTNKGTIVLNAGEEATNSYSYVGGIIGSYNKYTGSTATDCVNEGKVISNWHKKVWVGGITGALRGTYTNCVNKGDLELNGAAAAASGAKAGVAGICGFGGGSSVNCENYGKVTNNSTNEWVSASGYIGVVGATEQSHTGGIVKCDIVSANANIAIGLGGQQGATKTVTMGTEAAPIVVKAGTTLNGEAVTAETIQNPLKLATSLEEANIANIVYTIGSTVKFE